MSTGAQFGAVKEAKDFLVEKIAAEASRDHMPLSEVERQMLYFTEEDGLSEQMRQVCEVFDRDHDVDEYEAKIAGIVRSLLTRLSPADQELWDEAVRKLREGDHYLLVFIDAGSPPQARPSRAAFEPGSPTIGIRPARAATSAGSFLLRWCCLCSFS